MNDILQMWSNHPFWFCVLVYILLRMVWLILRMPFRCLNICIRGWPIGLIDADGDVVHPPIKEEERP